MLLEIQEMSKMINKSESSLVRSRPAETGLEGDCVTPAFQTLFPLSFDASILESDVVFAAGKLFGHPRISYL